MSRLCYTHTDIDLCICTDCAMYILCYAHTDIGLCSCINCAMHMYRLVYVHVWSVLCTYRHWVVLCTCTDCPMYMYRLFYAHVQIVLCTCTVCVVHIANSFLQKHKYVISAAKHQLLNLPKHKPMGLNHLEIFHYKKENMHLLWLKLKLPENHHVFYMVIIQSLVKY